MATKPLSSSVSPSRVMRLTTPRTQWWLVATSPSGDTNEAEHPGIRSTDMRARWNHSSSAWKPYVCEK